MEHTNAANNDDDDDDGGDAFILKIMSSFCILVII